ncbi:helix-turn-helix domain-containing protein [Advenella mimigardefordensis]|uniref:hypothetical protein n=1 Tax=Advenella mimigardefordensis TaxID=302406 RepID=UPI00046D9622|nr:hypothetical protein [Advenella mimigardefordensis]
MSKRIVEEIEVEASSGNVFAELNLPDPDKLQFKSDLTVEITKAIRDRGLSQTTTVNCERHFNHIKYGQLFHQ